MGSVVGANERTADSAKDTGLAAPAVDVVVVSYNSARDLRRCVEPLSKIPHIRVIVVDNASADGSLAVLEGLDLTSLARQSNDGFAVGCNAGWPLGTAPTVLFLNPDASIDERSVGVLLDVLETHPDVGAAAPRIEHPDGTLAWSQRRFPRLRATYARALFLHRLFPRAKWVDDMIRDPSAYARACSPEWVSGACVLVRRGVLELLEGWDEDFFFYGEDIDLCKRLRALDYGIRFEPRAVVVHSEGASAPRAETLPLLAASRLLYARKHASRTTAALERIGVGLEALIRLAVSRGGLRVRRGHARTLAYVVSGVPLVPGSQAPTATVDE